MTYNSPKNKKNNKDFSYKPIPILFFVTLFLIFIFLSLGQFARDLLTVSQPFIEKSGATSVMPRTSELDRVVSEQEDFSLIIKAPDVYFDKKAEAAIIPTFTFDETWRGTENAYRDGTTEELLSLLNEWGIDVSLESLSSMLEKDDGDFHFLLYNIIQKWALRNPDETLVWLEKANFPYNHLVDGFSYGFWESAFDELSKKYGYEYTKRYLQSNHPEFDLYEINKILEFANVYPIESLEELNGLYVSMIEKENAYLNNFLEPGLEILAQYDYQKSQENFIQLSDDLSYAFANIKNPIAVLDWVEANLNVESPELQCTVMDTFLDAFLFNDLASKIDKEKVNGFYDKALTLAQSTVSDFESNLIDIIAQRAEVNIEHAIEIANRYSDSSSESTFEIVEAIFQVHSQDNIEDSIKWLDTLEDDNEYQAALNGIFINMSKDEMKSHLEHVYIEDLSEKSFVSYAQNSISYLAKEHVGAVADFLEEGLNHFDEDLTDHLFSLFYVESFAKSYAEKNYEDAVDWLNRLPNKYHDKERLIEELSR